MNERRNATIRADNRCFSSSFHGFYRGDDSVAQRLRSRLALNPVEAAPIVNRGTEVRIP